MRKPHNAKNVHLTPISKRAYQNGGWIFHGVFRPPTFISSQRDCCMFKHCGDQNAVVFSARLAQPAAPAPVLLCSPCYSSFYGFLCSYTRPYTQFYTCSTVFYLNNACYPPLTDPIRRYP